MAKKILSLHDGHNASVAVFDGPHVLAAVSEERLNREKFYWGFPRLSIPAALDASGVKAEEIDVVAVSHLSALGYAKQKFSTRSTYDPRHVIGHIHNIFVSMKRDRAVRTFARSRDVFFTHHHRAHAASAYYFAGSENALVLTIDALGDSLSHTAYEVKDNVWRKLAEGGAAASLGAFYAAVTEGLGFTANRHEGKVVGLAANGDAKAAMPYIADLVHIQNDGLTFRRAPYLEIRRAVERALHEGIPREAIAAAGQSMLERLVVLHVRKLLSLTDVRFLACAGGVFANVKLNQRLLETGITDIFIQPAMGDEGLVLGAPHVYLQELGISGLQGPCSMYLGNVVTEGDIRDRVAFHGLHIESLSRPADEAARLIADGGIVGWFDGRMEFGPRALGARSILADPRNRRVNDILNARLKRSEFMPFAPSVLSERADELFEVQGARKAAEYMTITMNVRNNWRSKVPAIVHTDGTARPQLVEKEASPEYHALIASFEKKTGIPLVVNTSFNIHEEPIVSSAEDAMRSLVEGAVDCVIFNNRWLVTKPVV